MKPRQAMGRENSPNSIRRFVLFFTPDCQTFRDERQFLFKNHTPVSFIQIKNQNNLIPVITIIGVPFIVLSFDVNRVFKVARYSFSRSIPLKFERKLRRHKQRFGKIDTTVVLDKDENLLWSGLQWHRSCHSNEMTLLPILLAAVYLGTENCSSKIVHGSFFLLYRPRCSWSLSEIC